MTATTTRASERPTAEREPRSPRSWWATLLGIALVIAAGLVGWWLGSRSADDQVDDAPIVVDATVERWARAWSARDAVAFADLYEDDGVFEGVLGVSLVGRDAIRQGIDDYWQGQQLEVEYWLDAGSQGVAVWSIVGDGTDLGRMDFTIFEWAWDDPDLLRSTSMNW